MSDSVAENPDSLAGSVSHAWEAYHAGDWLESSARWDRVRKLFPDYAPPYIHGGNSLREAGRLDEALQKLKCGVEMFPDHPQLVTSIAICLERMGRFQEVTDWLEQAIPRFPNNPEVGVDYIRLSHERKDYRSVLRGFDLMEIVHPGRVGSDQGVQHMVSSARLQFEMSKMDAVLAHDVEPVSRLPLHQTNELSNKDLMLAFQSLGENCEFGLAQRHFQAEPLGLLRWAAISVFSLTQALDEDFEGVGVSQQTKFVTGENEYATAHVKYGMGSHTFVKVDKKNEEAIFDKLLARLRYLRRKLIEDLEEGDQIFVYTCENGVSENELTNLHRAIKRYGSRYLLFVRKSDPLNPPGTLTDAGDGLMLGYIDRLGPDRLPEGDVWNISYHHWAPMLRSAHDLCRRAEVDLVSNGLATAQIKANQTSLAEEASRFMEYYSPEAVDSIEDVVVMHDPACETLPVSGTKDESADGSSPVNLLSHLSIRRRLKKLFLRPKD